VDVPRDAGTRFAAARNRAYLVQIYVTVETIANNQNNTVEDTDR